MSLKTVSVNITILFAVDIKLIFIFIALKDKVFRTGRVGTFFKKETTQSNLFVG